MNAPEELKPCPFCGLDATYYVDAQGYTTVGCDQCDVTGRSHETMEAARIDWARRADTVPDNAAPRTPTEAMMTAVRGWKIEDEVKRNLWRTMHDAATKAGAREGESQANTPGVKG